MKLKSTLISLVVILLCGWSSISQANTLEKQEITLLEAIEKISKEYEVYFTFDMTLVADVKVEYEHTAYGSAEEAIANTLEDTNLKYKFYDQRFVILYKEDAEGLESLKKMSRHLDGLISEGEKTVVKTPKEKARAVPRLSSSLLSKTIEPIAFTVEGTVVDQGGEPLIGVNIQVKGSNKGTATDFEGRFALKDIDENAVLVVSYIGYQTQEVAVAGKSTLNITLMSDSQLLDEVVVVGYGTQKKVNLTGSVSSIRGERLSARQVGQTSMALQGAIPGVTVTQRSGQPGKDGGTIRIRGIGTLGDSNPLILIDGIPGDLNNVDPNIIENISILKDAASSSIYGARAANGVVLITTKRGVKGDFLMNYSSYFGFQEPTDLKSRVNAVDHMQMLNLANKNLNRSPIFSEDVINRYPQLNKEDPYRYPDTKWYDEVYTENGFMQNHNFNFTGGNESIKFMGSMGYLDQNGIMKNTNFKRYTFRLNSDIRLNKRIELKNDIFLRFMDTREPGDLNSVIFNTNHLASLEPSINSFGFGQPSTSQNPLSLLYDGGYHRSLNPSIRATLGLTYEVLKGLNLELNYTPHFWLNDNKRFQKVTTTFYPSGESVVSGSQVERLNQSDHKFLQNNYYVTMSYNKNVDYSSFNILLGGSQEDYHHRWISAFRDDFTLPRFDVLNAGSSNNQQNGGAGSDWAIRSLFGRISYSYDNKYLLESNFRYDGSSRFSVGNKWGFFPSFSAGWRISEERFWEVIQPMFSDLKARISWGVLGNQNIGTYPFDSYMSPKSLVLNGETINGLAANEVANSDISWETSKMINIGVDIELFQHFNLNYDFYVKNTDGILLRLDVPAIIGLQPPYQNAGEVENKGWDLGISYQNTFGDFEFIVGGALSDVKNKIVDLKGVNVEGLLVNFEGYPMNSFYGYVANGFFQSQEEIDSSPKQFGNVIPGSIKYQDLNGDGLINGEDRKIIGNMIPRFTYSLNTSFAWKGLDLNLFIQGVGKVDGYLYGTAIMPFTNGSSALEMHKDYWTENNQNAVFPSLAFNESNNIQNSSFWLKNSSYLRLKSAQLGFLIPSRVLKYLPINGSRFYVSGQNLFTVDKFWSGFDVESPVGDGSFYPQLQTYSFGLNINF